ncbi:hypothetical protein ACLOJK_003730 [Asimina triloba]
MAEIDANNTEDGLDPYIKEGNICTARFSGRASLLLKFKWGDFYGFPPLTFDRAFNGQHWKGARCLVGRAPLSQVSSMASLRLPPQRVVSLDPIFLSQAICCRPLHSRSVRTFPSLLLLPVLLPSTTPVTPPTVPSGPPPAPCAAAFSDTGDPHPLPLLSLCPLPASLSSPTPATPPSPSSFPTPAPCTGRRCLLRHRRPPPSPSPFPRPAPYVAAFSDTGHLSLFLFLPSACSLRLLPAPVVAAFSDTGRRCLLRLLCPLAPPSLSFSFSLPPLSPRYVRPASSLCTHPAASSPLSSPLSLSLSLPSLNLLFLRPSAFPLRPPGLPLLLVLHIEKLPSLLQACTDACIRQGAEQESQSSDKSLDCGFFRWVDGDSISKSGDEVSSHSQSYGGMEKIVELESDFGDLVGCVSDLKDFQLAESTRLKLTSQAELQQLKEKIRRLEEAESKREMKMDHLSRLIALHSAMFCITFAALCYLAFWM